MKTGSTLVSLLAHLARAVGFIALAASASTPATAHSVPQCVAEICLTNTPDDGCASAALRTCGNHTHTSEAPSSGLILQSGNTGGQVLNFGIGRRDSSRPAARIKHGGCCGAVNGVCIAICGLPGGCTGNADCDAK